jgi:hypothetical protein
MAKSTTETRRLIKFSNYSMCITLPKWVIDQLEWKKGDQLTLCTDVKEGKITLYKATESTQVSKISPVKEEEPATEATESTKLRW